MVYKLRSLPMLLMVAQGPRLFLELMKRNKQDRALTNLVKVRNYLLLGYFLKRS